VPANDSLGKDTDARVMYHNVYKSSKTLFLRAGGAVRKRTSLATAAKMEGAGGSNPPQSTFLYNCLLIQ
jgi:hypothetical protein